MRALHKDCCTVIKTADQVDCPRCGAESGYVCHPRSVTHYERLRAAIEESKGYRTPDTIKVFTEPEA